MKKYFLIIFLLLSTTILSADTYVDGYSRSDGTYVEGHYRSSPNDTVYDNYSTDGNVNPYTGKEGTKEVYDGEGYASSQLASSNSINKNNDDTGLIVFGVIAVVILFVAIIRYLMGFMFISYLVVNAKNVFWTWVILTLLNQILFFGACLHPYCILASIPHVSLFTFGIMYLMYKTDDGAIKAGKDLANKHCEAMGFNEISESIEASLAELDKLIAKARAEREARAAKEAEAQANKEESKAQAESENKCSE